jgi:hypothetical protein
MTQTEGEYHAREFLRRLREESVNKDDPIPEWSIPKLISFEYNETGGRCICKKDIFQIFQIENKHTKKTLLIGADCAKRWFSARYSCHRCKKPLGNIVKRLRESNFICPACAKEQRHHEKSNELLRQSLLTKYGFRWFNNHLNIPFPFQHKKNIMDHLEDEQFCNYILDLDTTHIDNELMPMPFKYYSEYLQDLQTLIRLTWVIEER